MPILLAVIVLALGAAVAHADPAEVPGSTWTPNRTVHAAAVAGGTAWVGGDFSMVSPYTGSFIVTDPASGAARPGWPDLEGFVSAAEPDGGGGWYVAGAFHSVGGQPQARLAHIRGDGTLDPDFAPQFNDAVSSIALIGDTLYVAGSFTQVNGEARTHLAAISRSDGSLTPFAPAFGTTDSVQALEVFHVGLAQEPVMLFVGGDFDAIAGATRHNLAVFEDGELSSVDPDVNGPVTTLEVAGNLGTGYTLYAGGGFSQVNGGTTRLGAAAFELDGDVKPWNPQAAGGAVHDLDPVGGLVYLAGAFSVVGGQPRERLAAVDSATGELAEWAPDTGDSHFASIDQVEAVGDSVYAAGYLFFADDPGHFAVAYDATSAERTAWRPRADGEVRVLAHDFATGDLAVGGLFDGAGGVLQSGLAPIDTASGALVPTSVQARGAVRALAVSGSRLYVGGLISAVTGPGGGPRSHLAALDLDSGSWTTFAPSVQGGRIEGLAVDGDVVYLAGTFTEVAGAPRKGLAAVRDVPGTAGALLPFAPEPDVADVRALALAGGALYVGGEFAKVGGQPRPNLAAVDASTGALRDWAPAPDGAVDTLLARDGRVYAGGAFSQPRRGLAAFDAAGAGAVQPFDAGLNGDVLALASYGDQVFAAGAFISPRLLLGAFDAITGAAAAWAPPAGGFNSFYPAALAASAETGLIVGGDFRIHRGPVRAKNLTRFALPALTGPVGPQPAPTPAPAPAGDSPPPPPAADTTPPTLLRLLARPKRFRRARGTRLTIELTEAATVRLELLKVRKGRRVRGRCRLNARRGRRCTRLVRRATLTRSLPAGVTRLRYRARRARPGGYRLRAIATDAAGNRGKPRAVALRLQR